MLDKLFPNEILTLTLYGEARGEAIEGQIAVANVIMNRFISNRSKYKTIIDVCLEPKQFSCWNVGDPNRVKLGLLVDQISEGYDVAKIDSQLAWIAAGIISRSIRDNTKGSNHYMTTDLYLSDKKPSWANNPKSTKVIGNHTFFLLV